MPNHEHLRKGEKEARIGLDSEQDIINRINNDEEFHDALKECLIRLGFTISGKLRARKDLTKADILLQINEQEEIGISLKSSEKTSFHQLDRRRLEVWRDLVEMPEDVFIIMKESILRVSENSRAKFILEKDRDRIKDFFASNLPKVIEDIFRRGEEKLKLFIINDKRKRRIYIFRMDDVIRFLNEDATDISFTKKGIIRLGKFITIQRKGGDSKHITIPKTDWNHPGNQLQFKFSPLRFAEYIELEGTIEFCIIDY
ncbi:hypothetical protein D9Q81_06850 [Candidatus Korarchaeum cryptofilum]|jgi:hypothetical protein|uniref:Uncharacterized protein n=1 Tax=Candidatus Korarchaeum cryptofilum TaxID=498846 RepID=A0A429G2K7_9CREN|nr:hypothetical protein [Candidatus Korarchaeum cryptofilum]RSN67998.1 hypothetical protein D9Q81_06850 [Candidatus Korarchaeum cryptofilum]